MRNTSYNYNGSFIWSLSKKHPRYHVNYNCRIRNHVGNTSIPKLRNNMAEIKLKINKKFDSIKLMTVSSEEDFFVENEELCMPGKNVFVVGSISKTRFNRIDPEFDYFGGSKKFKIPDGESWWIGGMQKWTTGHVLLITDTMKEVYIFCPFNGAGYPHFIGKLRSNTSYCKYVLRAFKTFLKTK